MGRNQDRAAAQAERERRKLEQAERTRLRLEALVHENNRQERELLERIERLRRESVRLDQIDRDDRLDVSPRVLPAWPTLHHVLATSGVYAGVAALFALLFVIGAVIHSFPVTVTSFAAGILATVMGVRLWRRMLRRGFPTLLDRMWERFHRNHYARH